MSQRINKKKEWSAEEVELIKAIYAQCSSKKWKRIAQILQNHGFNRTQIQCRERWINFINPKLNKDVWQEDELKKLYSMHQKVGSHWSIIQNCLGRTQNQIKNRFYGTLRNFIRYVINQITEKKQCYNKQISKLSPNFLNLIYHGKGQYVFLKKQVKQSIYSMNFKINKEFLAETIKNKRSLYQKMCENILKMFRLMKSDGDGNGNEKNETQNEEQDRIKEQEIEELDIIKIQDENNEIINNREPQVSIQTPIKQLQNFNGLYYYYYFPPLYWSF